MRGRSKCWPVIQTLPSSYGLRRSTIRTRGYKAVGIVITRGCSGTRFDPIRNAPTEAIFLVFTFAAHLILPASPGTDLSRVFWSYISAADGRVVFRSAALS